VDREETTRELGGGCIDHPPPRGRVSSEDPTMPDIARRAPGDNPGLNAMVAERLAAERQAADRGRLLTRIDAAGELTDTFAVLAVDVHGRDDAVAVAFLDSAAAARAFIARFLDDGVPSLWPCGTAIALTCWALDPRDPETDEQLCDLPRGRWLLRDDGVPSGLRDPAIRPHAAGAGRAARRREGGQ
jgi:hypothetical protein